MATLLDMLDEERRRREEGLEALGAPQQPPPPQPALGEPAAAPAAQPPAQPAPAPQPVSQQLPALRQPPAVPQGAEPLGQPAAARPAPRVTSEIPQGAPLWPQGELAEQVKRDEWGWQKIEVNGWLVERDPAGRLYYRSPGGEELKVADRWEQATTQETALGLGAISVWDRAQIPADIPTIVGSRREAFLAGVKRGEGQRAVRSVLDRLAACRTPQEVFAALACTPAQDVPNAQRQRLRALTEEIVQRAMPQGAREDWRPQEPAEGASGGKRLRLAGPPTPGAGDSLLEALYPRVRPGEGFDPRAAAEALDARAAQGRAQSAAHRKTPEISEADRATISDDAWRLIKQTVNRLGATGLENIALRQTPEYQAARKRLYKELGFQEANAQIPPGYTRETWYGPYADRNVPSDADQEAQLDAQALAAARKERGYVAGEKHFDFAIEPPKDIREKAIDMGASLGAFVIKVATAGKLLGALGVTEPTLQTALAFELASVGPGYKPGEGATMGLALGMSAALKGGVGPLTRWGLTAAESAFFVANAKEAGASLEEQIVAAAIPPLFQGWRELRGSYAQRLAKAETPADYDKLNRAMYREHMRALGLDPDKPHTYDEYSAAWRAKVKASAPQNWSADRIKADPEGYARAEADFRAAQDAWEALQESINAARRGAAAEQVRRETYTPPGPNEPKPPAKRLPYIPPGNLTPEPGTIAGPRQPTHGPARGRWTVPAGEPRTPLAEGPGRAAEPLRVRLAELDESALAGLQLAQLQELYGRAAAEGLDPSIIDTIDPQHRMTTNQRYARALADWTRGGAAGNEPGGPTSGEAPGTPPTPGGAAEGIAPPTTGAPGGAAPPSAPPVGPPVLGQERPAEEGPQTAPEPTQPTLPTLADKIAWHTPQQLAALKADQLEDLARRAGLEPAAVEPTGRQTRNQALAEALSDWADSEIPTGPRGVRTKERAGATHMFSVEAEPAAEIAGWADKAVREFGVTDDPKRAGWILPDGRMLDFSGGTAGKGLYHEDIARAIGVSRFRVARSLFGTATGAARVGFWADNAMVQLFAPATEEQIRIIIRAATTQDYMSIDATPPLQWGTSYATALRDYRPRDVAAALRRASDSLRKYFAKAPSVPDLFRRRRNMAAEAVDPHDFPINEQRWAEQKRVEGLLKAAYVATEARSLLAIGERSLAQIELAAGAGLAAALRAIVPALSAAGVQAEHRWDRRKRYVDFQNADDMIALRKGGYSYDQIETLRARTEEGYRYRILGETVHSRDRGPGGDRPGRIIVTYYPGADERIAKHEALHAAEAAGLTLDLPGDTPELRAAAAENLSVEELAARIAAAARPSGPAPQAARLMAVGAEPPAPAGAEEPLPEHLSEPQAKPAREVLEDVLNSLGGKVPVGKAKAGETPEAAHRQAGVLWHRINAYHTANIGAIEAAGKAGDRPRAVDAVETWAAQVADAAMIATVRQYRDLAQSDFFDVQMVRAKELVVGDRFGVTGEVWTVQHIEEGVATIGTESGATLAAAPDDVIPVDGGTLTKPGKPWGTSPAESSARRALAKVHQALVASIRARAPFQQQPRLISAVVGSFTVAQLRDVAIRIDLVSANQPDYARIRVLNQKDIAELRRKYEASGAAKGFRAGALAHAATQQELIDFINANLPISERGRLLTQVKNVRAGKTAEKDLAAARAQVKRVYDQWDTRQAVEDLQRAMAAAQKASRGGKLRDEMQAALDAILEDIRTVGISGKTKERLDAVLQYAEANPDALRAVDADGNPAPDYNPVLAQLVQTAKETLDAAGRRDAKTLGAQEVRAVTNAVTGILGRNRLLNQLTLAGRRHDLEVLAATGAAEVEAQGGKAPGEPGRYAPSGRGQTVQGKRDVGEFKKLMYLSQLKGENLALFLGASDGSVPHDVLYQQLYEGTRTEARVIQEAEEFLRGIMEDYGIRSERDLTRFSVKVGQQLGTFRRLVGKFLGGAIPSAGYKADMVNVQLPQARWQGSGAPVGQIESDRNTICGLIATLTDPHALRWLTDKGSEGFNWAWSKREDSIILGLADVNAIFGQFPKEFRMVQRAKEWMATTGYELANAAYFEANLHSMPHNPQYWPIRRNLETVQGRERDAFDYVSQASLQSSGWLKSRTGGTKPLVIDGFLETFIAHVSAVARYHALSGPVANAHRLLENPIFKKALADTFGEAWYRQLNLHIDATAGLLQHEPNVLGHLVNWLRGKVYKSTLGFKPFVMLKQLFSYPLALAELDARDIAAGLPHALRAMAGAWAHRGVVDEMLAWSPILRLRYESSGQRILGPGGDAQGIARFVLGHRGEWSMQGIQTLDRAAILGIWQAVKHATARMHPELAKGTPEYWDVVARRAEQVINRTQPTFDMVNRSAWAREAMTNPLLGILTMYTSQRNQNYNMLARAAWRLRNELAGRRSLSAPPTGELDPKRVADEIAGFLLAQGPAIPGAGEKPPGGAARQPPGQEPPPPEEPSQGPASARPSKAAAWARFVKVVGLFATFSVVAMYVLDELRDWTYRGFKKRRRGQRKTNLDRAGDLAANALSNIYGGDELSAPVQAVIATAQGRRASNPRENPVRGAFANIWNTAVSSVKAYMAAGSRKRMASGPRKGELKSDAAMLRAAEDTMRAVSDWGGLPLPGPYMLGRGVYRAVKAPTIDEVRQGLLDLYEARAVAQADGTPWDAAEDKAEREPLLARAKELGQGNELKVITGIQSSLRSTQANAFHQALLAGERKDAARAARMLAALGADGPAAHRSLRNRLRSGEIDLAAWQLGYQALTDAGLEPNP